MIEMDVEPPRLHLLQDIAHPGAPFGLFADVADNPGGGGRGNTAWILEAFHKAGAEGVLDDAAAQAGLQTALALKLQRESALAAQRSSYDDLSAKLKAFDEQRMGLERALDPCGAHGLSAPKARPGAGAYSASKFALAGWTDALYSEELPHGVHVGLVLPGFIETEGFPAEELKAKAATRWTVSSAGKAAQAIVECGLEGSAERYVPRPYALAAVTRILLPGLARRILSGGAGRAMTTATGPDRTPPAELGAGDELPPPGQEEREPVYRRTP